MPEDGCYICETAHGRKIPALRGQAEAALSPCRAAGSARRCAGKNKPALPTGAAVESAGIPDLDLGQDLLSPSNVKRGSRATITADAGAAERLRKLRSGVAGDDSVERMRKRGDVEQSASHRLEFRIDEFTNHDDFLLRGCIVNNIWLKASQCLTARVDA